MTTYRILGPNTAKSPVRHPNGQSYSAVPGQILDVPDFIASFLGGNGFQQLCPSGPTSARPAAAPSTLLWFIDTTLNKVIVHDGAVWRDPLTGNVV